MSFKYLVVLESPGKVKTVQSFLGSDYKVAASYGHMNYPTAKDGWVS